MMVLLEMHRLCFVLLISWCLWILNFFFFVFVGLTVVPFWDWTFVLGQGRSAEQELGHVYVIMKGVYAKR